VKGKFIVLEGPDGVGKSTQAKLLAARMRTKGLRVEEIPGVDGRTPLGKYAREILAGKVSASPREFQALVTADRVAKNRQMTEWADEGVWMVGDRWTLSAMVYGTLEIDDEAERWRFRTWLTNINQSPLVYKPSLYIVLHTDSGTLTERLSKRDHVEIYEKAHLISRVARMYRDSDSLVDSPVKHLVVNNDMSFTEGMVWCAVGHMFDLHLLSTHGAKEEPLGEESQRNSGGG